MRQLVRQYLLLQKRISDSDEENTGRLEEELEDLYYELTDEEIVFIESKLEENEYFDTY